MRACLTIWGVSVGNIAQRARAVNGMGVMSYQKRARRRRCLAWHREDWDARMAGTNCEVPIESGWGTEEICVAYQPAPNQSVETVRILFVK